MKRVLVLATIVLLPASATAQFPEWFAGCWQRETRNGVNVERWGAVNDGRMLGHSRSVRPDGTVSGWERLSLEQVAGRLSFVAVPSGQTKAAFPVVGSWPDSIRFELPSHDFPQRLTYHRHGNDSLTARVENLDGGGFTTGWHRTECSIAEKTEVSFVTDDSVTVFGDLRVAPRDITGPVILALHQSASNSAEYDAIAPRLVAAGYHVLAIDARGGGSEAHGGTNRTVDRLPHRGNGPLAIGDFRAAIRWLRSEGFTGPLAIIGSSYSAGRMFWLLADSTLGINAAAAFSPGAAFARTQPDGSPAPANATTIPVFVTWSPDELDADREARFEEIASSTKEFFRQRVGVHGASTLRPDSNPQGHHENMERLLDFLWQHLPVTEPR